MSISLLPELRFKTSRSGGKGGQNVNKVETAVTGIWKPAETMLLTEEQIERALRYLQTRLNKEGELLISSQAHRSQLANKEEVVKKFHVLINRAIEIRRPRIATKMPKAVKEKRLEQKKQRSEIKQGRGRMKW